MKKIFLIMLMAAAAAAVFASGAQEADEDGIVRLEPGTPARNSYLEDLEQIEVRGTLNFESPVPELVSGGKTYTLFAPGAMMFTDYVKEGDKLVVKGYIMDENTAPFGRFGGPGMRTNNDVLKGNTTLLVASVELNGTTYELPWVNNGDEFCGPGGFDGARGGARDGGPRGNNGDWMSGPGGMRGGYDDDSFRSSRRF